MSNEPNASKPQFLERFRGLPMSGLAESLIRTLLALTFPSPEGQIVGAAISPLVTNAIQNTGEDLKKRQLSPLEDQRVGAAYVQAVQRLGQYIEDGGTVRGDGFFEPNPSKGRSDAEEILEGVILAARDSYETKKIQYISNLYASIAIYSEISAMHANFLITLAEKLTYSQLVILSIAKDNPQPTLLRMETYRENVKLLNDLDLDGISIATETYELYTLGLIHGGDGQAWLGIVDIPFGRIQPHGIGRILHTVMNLEDIPRSDKARVYELFPPSKR